VPQLATFSITSLYFGVEVQRVQEVLRYQEMTPVPLAPPEISGLINLRGQIITAIDLRKRLRIDELRKDSLPMNVIVRTPEGPVSLLVDSIGDVIEVGEDVFEETPDMLPQETRTVINGLYKLSDKLLLLLNVDRAVDVSGDAQATEVAHAS
jgi:purine-binding chemotaxis protein CheW